MSVSAARRYRRKRKMKTKGRAARKNLYLRESVRTASSVPDKNFQVQGLARKRTLEMPRRRSMREAEPQENNMSKATFPPLCFLVTMKEYGNEASSRSADGEKRTGLSARARARTRRKRRNSPQRMEPARVSRRCGNSVARRLCQLQRVIILR